MRGFFSGVQDALGSTAWWKRTPSVMWWGLVPAAIVNAFAVTAFLLVMLVVLPSQLDAITAFAADWPPIWAGLLRAAIVIATGAGLILLISATFVALTLAIGDPFYERIWREVEVRLHGAAPDVPYGFFRGVGDSLRLLLRGLFGAVLAGVIGLIPIIGGVLGFIVGLSFTGWGLASELLGRALTHRGLDAGARARLLRSQRGRVLGFGVVAQLSTMVPLLSVIAMPTLVAGATQLASDLLGGSAAPGRMPATPPTADSSAPSHRVDL